jgi:hypothetical protein
MSNHPAYPSLRWLTREQLYQHVAALGVPGVTPDMNQQQLADRLLIFLSRPADASRRAVEKELRSVERVYASVRRRVDELRTVLAGLNRDVAGTSSW